MSGPKTVTCCICNQTVNKKQTLQTPKGRACRSHEGVEDQAAKSQEKLESEQQKGRERKPRRQYEPEEPITFTPKCCGCRHEGMHAKEWMMRLLVLQEKYELVYGKTFNPFDVEDCQKAYSELKGIVPLFPLTYPLKKKIRLHSFAAHQVGLMLGFIVLCKECCDKHGIDPMPHTKDITLDQLIKASAGFEAFVRPVLQEQAKSEIEQSN